MQDALKVPPTPRTSLSNGFWPITRVQSSVNDMMRLDGIMREDFAKDKPFIGLIGEQLHSSL